MQDLETECLNKINIKFSLYYRYVDDIILAAPVDKIDLIFKIFNDYHDRLKFTIEHEDNRSLSFLDLLTTTSNNTIYIDWIHKKTFWKILSFHSSHPSCHKIGTIYSLKLTEHFFFYTPNSIKKIWKLP